MIFLLSATYSIIQFSSIQTSLTQYFANNLSEKLNSKITIGSVDISFFSNLILEDIYLEDQNSDTLFFIEKLVANINSFSIDKKYVKINKITLENSRVKFSKDSLSVLNLRFFIDSLKTENKDTTLWQISCSDLEMSNSTFSYKSFNNEQKIQGINYNDIYISNFSFSINDFETKNDSIIFRFSDLSLVDKSNFEINLLESSNIVTKNEIILNNLKIKTPFSELFANHYIMKFDSVINFHNFNENVKIIASIERSNFGLTDLSMFSPKLHGIDQNVRIDGDFSGYISNFKVKNLNIEYGNTTKISLKCNIQGLPDISNTFFYASVNQIVSTKTDIESFNLPYFVKNRNISLTENLKTFGEIEYKGKISGFIYDFVSYGRLQTDLGNLITDISIKQDRQLEKVSFNGNFKTEDFKLASIFQNEKLPENASINTKINGNYQKSAGIFAELDGSLKNIEFNNYTYSDIEVSGKLSDKKFDGQVKISDPNVNLDFLGLIDFSQETPIFDFTAFVSDAKLKKLNFVKQDSLAKLSFMLSANFVGDEIDNSKGKIELFGTKFQNKKGSIDLNEFSVISTEKNNSDFLQLNSDFVDLEILGTFKIENLYTSFEKLFHKYFPSFSRSKYQNLDTTNNFVFSANLKNTQAVSRVFFPYVFAKENTNIHGKLNSINKTIHVAISSPEIDFKGNKLKDFSFNVSNLNDSLFFLTKAKNVNINKTVNIDNFVVSASAKKDSLGLSINWQNLDTLNYNGNILTRTFITKNEKSENPIINISVQPSIVTIADTVWTINSCKINIDSTFIGIDSFMVFNENQHIALHGALSEIPNDTLKINLQKINLSYLNLFTANTNAHFEGKIDGEAQLIDFYERSIFFSDIKIKNLNINNEKIGYTEILSDWDKNSKSLHLHAFTKRDKIKTFIIDGNYLPNKNELEFDISLDKLRLNIFEPYLKENISELRGIASGKLKLEGQLKKPVLNGIVQLQKSSFTINYLQTRYNLSDSIFVENNLIKFENTKINDSKYGTSAIAKGEIRHDYFKNFFFDINIVADKFLCLDTRESDNELYFGTAFASGLIKINGALSNIEMDINAKTEKNSRFYIPLTSESEISESNFITFVNENIKQLEIIEEESVDLSGVKLNFQLEVTPECEAQLIFDSKMGDVIKGNGNANLKMEISSAGEFNMFGNYEIDRGEYNFTLQNFFSKKFRIKKGGTIKWNGDPYDADVDLLAYYDVSTSLDNLLLDTSEIFRKRIPVECLIHMTDKILNPKIDFSIDLPDSDEKTKDQVNNLTENETNKQFISLLVINRFQPLSYLSNSGSDNFGANYSLTESGTEILSNQLSHWLSQISNDFDIGFNYRQGDELSSDEIEVALETQLWNDRVRINGNFGVGGQYENANKIVGDFDIDFKLNKSGKLRAKYFTKANNSLIYDESPYTQGVGVFYREEFNKLSDLFRKYSLFK
ncbi:MAG: translocation/assembly module TamB [Bacteroidetes bacterium]|nr:translocation/assembly module TamB [Bacteroidota bacterium]MBT6687862.1 translocation/assembly module TamB [Bacteroidota bacterium]MBT7144332.1 translocation/assembly module TamB [Bacteroidota bacterium]MBT7492089.1 translocation/assembly module TamB [Bacteroidota bacterium]